MLQCSEDLDFIKERSNKKQYHTNIKPVFCFILQAPYNLSKEKEQRKINLNGLTSKINLERFRHVKLKNTHIFILFILIYLDKLNLDYFFYIYRKLYACRDAIAGSLKPAAAPPTSPLLDPAFPVNDSHVIGPAAGLRLHLEPACTHAWHEQ